MTQESVSKSDIGHPGPLQYVVDISLRTRMAKVLPVGNSRAGRQGRISNTL